jgi:hypothetical protein
MYAPSRGLAKPSPVETGPSGSPDSNPARPEGIARGEIRQHIRSLGNFVARAASVNCDACTLAAEFDERAAIAEYDGNLSRQEAEAQAELELGIAPLALPWCFDRVEFLGPERAWYQPCEDGPACVIVPVIEDGCAVDLAAIDLETQHVGTRLGIGRALGLDAIDDVRWNGGVLHLVEPLDWLREPAAAACIIDWRSAAFTLADLDRPTTTLACRPIEVRCSTFALAARVERAFSRPLPAPDLHVRMA